MMAIDCQAEFNRFPQDLLICPRSDPAKPGQNHFAAFGGTALKVSLDGGMQHFLSDFLETFGFGSDNRGRGLSVFRWKHSDDSAGGSG
jgi:hypothetical protein